MEVSNCLVRSLTQVVHLLAVVQLLGIEEAEKKESHGPTTWQTARPDSARKRL